MSYEGPGGSSGRVGNPIDAGEAARVEAALKQPSEATMREAGLYDNAGFCLDCGSFYCPQHWNISATGMGTCPKGHLFSLDPHWSPDFDFDDDDNDN